MKNIIKLSLGVSIILVTTQGLGADTLIKAFEEGKVSGEIKSLYFQKEVSDKKVSVWTNGGNLSYKTGNFYGFNAGVTVQASTVTASDLDNAPTAYNQDQNVSGAVLSQAYLQYSRDNTTAKVGRQYISSPLLEGSGSRMFKESFEGVVLTNTDISNTTILAAYVDKEQYRTNIASGGTDVKDVSDFEQIQNGAYTLYVNNKSIENLNVDAQYLQINSDTTLDDTKALYTAVSYGIKPITVALQSYQTDNGKDENSRGKEYGINVTSKLDKLSLGAAYTLIEDSGDIVPGIGNGADYSYTASWIYGGIYDADTDAYRLSAGYEIIDDLTFELIYSAWKTGKEQRASETDYVTTYEFNKNLSTTFALATYDKLAEESYRSRLYVSYKF
ncbi:OprD family outer membrane porin [Arcobacter caeni]|uniref:Porin domain-containing protein n=1 Tax=Arcobacter caeni TaxID=1912877 RepID=A0A363D119_9BACT|nr:OprD family outer membrane porin [Arcobacter caeni]PUE65028.1 hypothetical protein B0174_05845 [Arcobacter caeni]